MHVNSHKFNHTNSYPRHNHKNKKTGYRISQVNLVSSARPNVMPHTRAVERDGFFNQIQNV